MSTVNPTPQIPPPLPKTEAPAAPQEAKPASTPAHAKPFPKRMWDRTGLHASRLISTAHDAQMLGAGWTDEAPVPGRPAVLPNAPTPHAKAIIPGTPAKHDPDRIHSTPIVPAIAPGANHGK